MAERYYAGCIFIAAAGQVDHDALVRDCERLFGGIPGLEYSRCITPPTEHSVVVNHQKSLEQMHICIGGPGLSSTSDLRYAGYVLNTALGGGMSSRLFQEVREKRGRVYTIHSFSAPYADCGYFGIYAGTNSDWRDEVIEVTVKELGKIKRDGLTPAELARAKSQIKGNMLLGLESTESRMNRLARNEIYFSREMSLEELTRGIDSVTNDQIAELAALWFEPKKMAMILLGDAKGRNVPPDIFSALL